MLFADDLSENEIIELIERTHSADGLSVTTSSEESKSLIDRCVSNPHYIEIFSIGRHPTVSWDVEKAANIEGFLGARLQELRSGAEPTAAERFALSDQAFQEGNYGDVVARIAWLQNPAGPLRERGVFFAFLEDASHPQSGEILSAGGPYPTLVDAWELVGRAMEGEEEYWRHDNAFYAPEYEIADEFDDKENDEEVE